MYCIYAEKNKEGLVKKYGIHKRILIFFSVVSAVVLIATAIFVRQQQTLVQHAATACLQSPVSYHVSGKNIVDNNGNILVPYGMQLDGILLAQTNWQTDDALTYLTQQQVQIAHDFWHANTVSLQIGSKALFDQSPYDSSYLAAVDQTIAWANQLGMNVILVLQYQGYGNSYQPMPTQDSVNFWNIVSKRYANNQQVFFDIFNEPNVPGGGDDNDAAWNLWQNGGVGNDGNTYVGFQTLVNTIRNNGANNIILADGLASGEDIALLPNHTLQGSNIAYAIHPYLGGQHSTQADWDGWFGNAITNGNFPVVADEWSQYQDQYSSGQSCLTNAPDLVPQFLSYMLGKHTGIIGYALFPGTLIRGWNFTNPTTFDTNPETCPVVSFPDTGNSAQGAGQLLANYFASNSAQLSACPTSTPTPSPSPTPTYTPTPQPTNTPTPTPIANVIQNPSFENTGSSWLNPWIFKTTTGAKGSISQTSSTKADGKYAANISITTSNSNDWYVQLIQGNLNIVSGHTYTLSFWAKASKSRSMRVVLQQNYGSYSTYFQQTVSLTTSWKQFTFTYTPAQADTNVLLAFNVAQATGNVWIDGVKLL